MLYRESILSARHLGASSIFHSYSDRRRLGKKRCCCCCWCCYFFFSLTLADRRGSTVRRGETRVASRMWRKPMTSLWGPFLFTFYEKGRTLVTWYSESKCLATADPHDPPEWTALDEFRRRRIRRKKGKISFVSFPFAFFFFPFGRRSSSMPYSIPPTIWFYLIFFFLVSFLFISFSFFECEEKETWSDDFKLLHKLFFFFSLSLSFRLLV